MESMLKMRTTRIRPLRALLLIIIVLFGATHAEQPASAVPSVAAETAKSFLQLLDQGKVEEALKWWKRKVVDAKPRARIKKQAQKSKPFAAFKRVAAKGFAFCRLLFDPRLEFRIHHLAVPQ